MNSAPPRSERPTSTDPPCRRATWATRASPTPRPPSPGGLGGPAALERVPRVLGREPLAAVADADLGAARHRRRGGPAPGGPRARRRRRTRCRPGCRSRSPGPATVRRPSARSPSTTRSMPRSPASADLPSSSADEHRVAHRIRPPGRRAAGRAGAPRWRTPTASSGRPISIRETTVCSRLAASWVCARSDSVRLRTTSSSPVTDCSSVWSRRVTTAPTDRPSQAAGAELTTSARSPAR